ncbi:uncharacterized protein DUF3105 [Frondihabitans sp. PhB188]|uniref:DUF3105 domain-containing protein n=1 Tax=Frondihabitans sp. PhB188 TaxID=2485200 RepID=UPI000FB07BDE|nr:DUF3105 domain-containing protein [Frondihabitans sp. PhB188]ROQ40089.1 uncharacterized protein DUF3105 [Frondihabitans sp. PhB188]
MATKAEKSAERRAKAEALRKQEEAQQRRRLIFIIAGAVATAIVIVLIFVSTIDGNKAADTGAASTQVIPAAVPGTTKVAEAKATPVADDSGIDGVLAWDTTGWPGDGKDHAGALEHDHVTGPVTYSVTPPVGGPHDAIWMNAGVYTKPVPTERAVHNLEHGAVWITYDPDLPADQVKQLTAFVGRQTMIEETEQNVTGQANRYVDLSPWASDDLPSKIVISAWGHQLRVDSADDSRLQTFVDTFRDSKTYTPEYGAQVDGVPVQTGGVPASDGSRKANPAGSASE